MRCSNTVLKAPPIVCVCPPFDKFFKKIFIQIQNSKVFYVLYRDTEDEEQDQ